MDFDDLDLEVLDKETLSNGDLEALHNHLSEKLITARNELAGMSRYSVFVGGEQGSYDIERMVENASEEVSELTFHLDQIVETLQNRAFDENNAPREF